NSDELSAHILSSQWISCREEESPVPFVLLLKFKWCTYFCSCALTCREIIPNPYLNIEANDKTIYSD
ncbi:unnamed protein product, partial [Allacma fusca]